MFTGNDTTGSLRRPGPVQPCRTPPENELAALTTRASLGWLMFHGSPRRTVAQSSPDVSVGVSTRGIGRDVYGICTGSDTGVVTPPRRV